MPEHRLIRRRPETETDSSPGPSVGQQLDSRPFDTPVQGAEASGGRADQEPEIAAEDQREGAVGHRLELIRIGPPSPTLHAVQRHPDPLAVQRDGPLTLTTPSLLQPADPAARYHLGGEQHLHLDPAIEAAARQMIQRQLSPAVLRPRLAQIRLAPARLMPGPSGVSPAALAGPPIPQPAPLVPAGAGPDTPRAAEASDVLEAVMAIPAIDQGITSLQTLATDRVLIDWRKLSTGEKVGVVSTVVTIGLGALGGVASDPAARRLALSQLNGRILPVPGVDWLHLEVNTGGDALMVGMHLDVGRLLPKNLGFGPGSPSAIGGPPQPEPFLPGQRQADGAGQPSANDGQSGPSMAQRIGAASAAGEPLDRGLRRRLETGLDTQLPPVRIHRGGEADHLARSLNAVAFTTGSDVFFRSGAYSPDSAAGYRLLAHEAAHTVQQAAGPVAGTPARGGVSISDPTDSFERAAERAAESATDPEASAKPMAG